MQLNIYAILSVVIFSIGAAIGWQVNNWRHDSIQLAADSAAVIVAEQNQAYIASAAAELEAKIASRAVTERVIERGVIKEIRNNEIVYRNVCITDAGRVHINSTAKGRVSSESAKALP